MTAPTPDRIAAVAQAFRVADGSHTLGAAALAEVAVAALDAYDRERGIVRTADYLVSQGGPVVVDMARIEADLRERIAAEVRRGIPHESCDHVACTTRRLTAARIARGQA